VIDVPAVNPADLSLPPQAKAAPMLQSRGDDNAGVPSRSVRVHKKIIYATRQKTGLTLA
tara:strand:+ start:1809 stop:1985 length:177 start_codon:yes stop_codon:yes gene_type:complete